MALTSGNVVGYPYLWFRQHKSGETEGRKLRPVCVAIAARDKAGLNHIVLLSISSQKPTEDQKALKLPKSERKLIGLNLDNDAWVYLNEYNYDIEEHSYYLAKRGSSVKSVSSAFLRKLVAAFASELKRGADRIVRR